ncbi:IS1595 family transposase [Acidocella sp.]|uniref:IS1595 family transposase n=1 Tax=Acidocella sp. TaxID=50710 RepID=UPI0026159320|nr:IS1595 family transposase [Acidocella sp.]
MQRFSTEESARAYFEHIRWPNGPTCPHCGNSSSDRIYKVTANPERKIRDGLYKCAECLQGFTVTVGTVMEDSHLPLNKWLIAFYMMCASKTQVSALQLQRQLEIGSYRTAWFLCHRIRYALKEADPRDLLVGTVEADETYIGGKARGKGRGYVKNKTAVVSLVERGGRVRSRALDTVNSEDITSLLRANVASDACLNTDESPLYKKVGKEFFAHDTVNHSIEEYARNDKKTGRKATTNAAEGFFGNSKRSIDGTHHHIGRKHVGLYFAELDHKYSNRKLTDGARTQDGIKKMEGKRLILRPSTKQV